MYFKQKKKKNKVEVEEPPAKVITSRADITDDVIVSRIDEKLLKKVCLFIQEIFHLLLSEINEMMNYETLYWPVFHEEY